jgi:hypothetical protein
MNNKVARWGRDPPSTTKLTAAAFDSGYRNEVVGVMEIAGSESELSLTVQTARHGAFNSIDPSRTKFLLMLMFVRLGRTEPTEIVGRTAEVTTTLTSARSERVASATVRTIEYVAFSAAGAGVSKILSLLGETLNATSQTVLNTGVTCAHPHVKVRLAAAP